MGKGADAPDVTGAAQETGKQARALNEAQTIANRPDQYNAWGSTQWDIVPQFDEASGQVVNRWVQREQFNPAMQQAITSQQDIQSGRSQLAQAGMARVYDQFMQPSDTTQFGQAQTMRDVGGPQQFNFDGQPVPIFSSSPNEFRQRAENAAYQRATSRLDPQFAAREQDLLIRLRNQGLNPGDRAYDAAVSNFNRARTDAYEQARLGATAEGRGEAQQMFGQELGAFEAQLAGQGQGFGQGLQSAQYNLGAQQAAFGQSAQQAQMAEMVRQQRIADYLRERERPLYEVEQLLAGQGITGGPPSTGSQTETLIGNTLLGKGT